MPTAVRKTDQVVFAQSTRGGEGDILAVAVPGQEVGLDAERREQPEHAEARCPDRWLGHIRSLEFLAVRRFLLRRERRRRVDELPERFLEFGRQCPFGPVERLANFWERHRQLSEHVRVLRPLPGKRNATFPLADSGFAAK